MKFQCCENVQISPKTEGCYYWQSAIKAMYAFGFAVLCSRLSASCLLGFNPRDFIKAFQIRTDYSHTINLQNSDGQTLNSVRIKSFSKTTKGERLSLSSSLRIAVINPFRTWNSRTTRKKADLLSRTYAKPKRLSANSHEFPLISNPFALISEILWTKPHSV